MQENSLYKAIYNLGSVKDMSKKLGIQREHIYAWIKGVSKIPLEYALQIDYLTGGEIDWKELVPFHVVQRLRHLTLVLPKFDLPPCELVYVSIERIKCAKAHTYLIQSENDPLLLNKKRPICIDSDNSLIFGEQTLSFYKQHHKRTIPAWRISLADLAEGCYEQELFIRAFFISERVAIGIALENFLGKHQGQRNDLKNKKISALEPIKEEISSKLMQHSAQVCLKNFGKLRALVASRLGFGSHFTYLSAKKIKSNGSEQLIARVDQKELAISTAARLSKLSIAEQNTILTQSKKNIIKKAFEIGRVCCSNELSLHAKSTSNEENHVLSKIA
ncbi:YdaS family helix-turn-helix protein [Rickettsiella endosymbiont of Dermanyssus gallinae]|uniref:YdaS family helix-turn-helix protein n=1 Tax=Rickettsiella endosymbiont of Dermanyssus gallinae TaxID=2856608 RepID=UPI001C52F3D1|nr:YdaS family helix-turn-helix protein [Rickettsiella endosymbiont of Dermanyssus gallinae]